MRLRPAWLLLPLLTSVIALTSCGGEKRTTSAPPARATAPNITASTAPAPKIQETLKPKTDPVVQVLADVETAYQAGRANYAAGHMEAAKADFDHAVDLLLQSPVPVKSDDRLQQEFDRVVEGVHDLEMVALKEGDGFTEQKSEPAPIDEANEVTFPVDPNVRAKAEAELKNTHSDLPLVMNDEVAGYVNFYSNTNRGRNTLEHAWTRAGRYRDMISRVLKEEGVPQDLIYLAEAESGFVPLALSRVGARGMWQFMASRASGYGLERNWWVDERQDPEKATRAAARHLKDLYNQFGDWYLAMAAYNSGPGNVQQAVKRTGYADFWELYRRNVLPKETKNYVPIIVAMTIIAKNPSQYGLEGITPDPPLQFETLHIDYPVDLRLVAEAVDAPVDALQELNPSLLRMTTPKEGGFDLRLPVGSKEKYEAAIAAIPADKRVSWRFHSVQSGDTLASIAKRYKTTTRAIAQANDMAEDEDLGGQTKLIIPVTAANSRYADGAPVAYSKKGFHYHTRKGDTLLSVADDFGVPAEQLRKWNHLRGNDLRKGRTLVIYKPVDPELAVAEKTSAPTRSSKSKKAKGLAASKVYHKVKAGETLYSIANAYGTTVEALKRDNPRLSATLRPGDTLVVRGVR
jgi:membrane-bound lytic murein transglycosylase D